MPRRRISWFGLVILLCLGTIGAMHSRVRPQSKIPVATQATNGPYRDGLLLGLLTAERGERYHAALGRSATKTDRAAFVAGYQEGYSSPEQAATPPQNQSSRTAILQAFPQRPLGFERKLRHKRLLVYRMRGSNKVEGAGSYGIPDQKHDVFTFGSYDPHDTFWLPDLAL